MSSRNIANGKISKTILTEGTDPIPSQNDTKVMFYHKTTRLSDGSVLDDNRNHSTPLEIIFGKQFKLEVWEECLKTMQLHEVARFTVSADLLSCYPLVAKSLRDIAKNHDGTKCIEEHDHEQHHCCGMQSLLIKGLGYPDLDDFMKSPEDLEFELEVVQVLPSGSYEKDAWAMNSDEKVQNVPRLHEEGNRLYKKQKYVEASDRYSRALGLLEQLMGNEKPESEEWLQLDKMMIPLLLNYSQCQLILGHYNEAIQHTTTIVDKEPGNVKAWYRRAKAHVMAWDPKEARDDFARALELDPALKIAVQKDLKVLDEMQRERDMEDRERMRNLFG